MKQKDIAVIVAVVFFSAVASLVLSNIVFPSGQEARQKVEQVDVITADFSSPETDDKYKKYFNDKSIDPTQVIEVTDNNNNNPFNGTSQ